MSTQIIEAVTKLNEAFFDGEAPIDFTGFEYKSTGYAEQVYFLGIQLWTSDDDVREFDEVTHTYEPYISCFKREALCILDKIKQTKTHLQKIKE